MVQFLFSFEIFVIITIFISIQVDTICFLDLVRLVNKFMFKMIFLLFRNIIENQQYT